MTEIVTGLAKNGCSPVIVRAPLPGWALHVCRATGARPVMVSAPEDGDFVTLPAPLEIVAMAYDLAS